MNFPDLTKNQYVQESTFHGVSHLRYSKSKARIAFWLILTLVGIGYTCFEISTEIDRISSGVKFEANYPLARTNEIHLPWIAYCYSNPLDIFDWAIVANYMDVYNWTIEDVGHLLSLDPAFTDFKLMSTTVSKQHFYRFRKINYEFFESMHKEICQEQNRTGGSPLVVTPRLVDMTPCILIDCLPNDEANEDLVYSLIASGNNMGDEVAMNLRLSIIDFMWKVHGLHLDTVSQDYIFSPELNPMFTSLRMNSINAFSIDPKMVNMPTMTKVICRKWYCNLQGQEPICPNFSFRRVEERGIDCFQWKYKTSNIGGGGLRFWKNHPPTREYTILQLLYPHYNNWQVHQYIPLSSWYQTVSNIGGTLSIWTGASVSSFLHLIEFFCYKCYKHKWKVGNCSQTAQPVV